MKTFAAVAVLGLAVLGASVWADDAATATAPASALKTDKERISYAIGTQLGGKLKGVEIDSAAMAAGIRDAATDVKIQMSRDEMIAAMKVLQKQLQDAQVAAVTDNQKAGDKFLAENAKKDGVKTTASGLQYKVNKSGAGKTPKSTDTVSVNYKGTLIPGKEFDASRGEPISFQVDGVIAGWTEALQLMKEGDNWTVYIPSKLAYGERGSPDGSIGPNETLIFEVELVAVK